MSENTNRIKILSSKEEALSYLESAYAESYAWMSDIAKELGVSKMRVRTVLHEMGYAYHKRKNKISPFEFNNLKSVERLLKANAKAYEDQTALDRSSVT